MELTIPLSGSAVACDDGDDERVRRARTDRFAFAELYRRHYAAVAVYVYRRVGNRHAAEDIVTEVFIAAMKSIGRYQPRGVPIRAWFYRIATNAVNRWSRRQRRWAWLTRGDPATLESVASPPTDAGADGQHAVAAMLCLSPHFAAVLALHYCEGLSVEEVAQVLGCRVGTVKSRLSRGRDALRKVLVLRS